MNYKKLQNIEIEKVFCIFKNKNHTGTTFLVLGDKKLLCILKQTYSWKPQVYFGRY